MTSKLSQLTLFRGWAEPGRYVWSPFVTKLEFRLRTAGVKYETQAGSTRTAPKGKIPYVDISPMLDDTASQEQTQFGDSTLIIQRLVRMDCLPDINEKLSEHEELYDLAIKAMLEDKLYFYHGRERWIDNYYVQRDKALEAVPWPMRVFIGAMIYRNIKAMLHAQGVGRFTSEEIYAFKEEIWGKIDDALSASKRKAKKGQPFWLMGGSQPTEADACVYGFIISVLVADSGPESKQIVKGFPSVLDYAERIHNRWFPDYEKWD